MRLNGLRDQMSVFASFDPAAVVHEILYGTRYLATANENGAAGLFQKSGELVLVEEIDGKLAGPRVVNDKIAKSWLEYNVEWIRVTNPANGPQRLDPIPCHKDIATSFVHTGDWPARAVPRLRGVSEWVTTRPDGTLVMDSGYDRDTEVWVRMGDDVRAGLERVEDDPPPEHVVRAREILTEDLLGDFEFVDASSAANAVAACLTGALRFCGAPLVPLHLLDATTQGAGKGTLAGVIARMFGCEPAETVYPKNDDEMAKSVVGILRGARPVVIWDNVEAKMDGETLAVLLTSRVFEKRLLGGNDMFTGDNDRLWIATGNNIALGGDIRRRSVLIRQEPTVDPRAGKRIFRHPDLAQYMRDNRTGLAWAVGTLIRAWASAGMPEMADQALVRRVGNFGEWARLVGGVLDVAGISGFLGNVEQLMEEDETSEELDAFISAMVRHFRDQPFTARSAMDALQNGGTYGPDPEDEDAIPEQTRRAASPTRSLGRYLEHVRGKPSGERKIERFEGGPSRGGKVYRVSGVPSLVLGEASNTVASLSAVPSL